MLKLYCGGAESGVNRLLTAALDLPSFSDVFSTATAGVADPRRARSSAELTTVIGSPFPSTAPFHLPARLTNREVELARAEILLCQEVECFQRMIIEATQEQRREGKYVNTSGISLKSSI